MPTPTRSVVITASALLLALATVVTAVAAAQSDPASESGATAAKPKTPPRVFVKKADGSSVRGELVEADGIRLSVRPAEGKSLGEPVEIKWADVKTVSNGLTREKAQQAWKAEHKDELCETCKGERVARCDTCKGTRHDPAASADCKTCKGKMLVECTEKKCDDGKAPCPGPCLKLSEGTWSKPDAEGKRWRSFRAKDGVHKISDAHVGEVVKVEKGEFKSGTPCEVCGKTGSVSCPTCAGHGDVACPTCKADKAAADCAACEDGGKACPTCAGTGLKGQAAAVPPVAAEPAPAAPAPAEPAPPAAPQPPTPPAPKGTTGDGLE